MVDYVAAVWRCRYFWLSLVKMDLETRYRRSVLGLGWSLLHPIVLTVIVYTAFHSVFREDVPHYALYVLTGLVVWNYFSSVTILGCNCFLQAEGYIRQHPAPLAIFPLRTALGGMVHLAAALVVVLVFAKFSVGLSHNPLVLLSLAPGLLLLFALGWSMALLAGCINVLFRDTEHLVQVGLQILFYATPIIYPAHMLEYHPLASFLSLLREPIYHHRVPHWSIYATGAGTVLLLGGVAALVLKRLQAKLIFYL
jgi:lipopolysaccharide transport system permease protein